MSTSRSARAASLLLAAAAVAAGLVLLETALRVAAFLGERRALAAGSAPGERPAPGAEVTLGSLVQPSTLRDVVYELRPGLRVRFLGRPVTIGTNGFRDRDYALAKPEGTRRIVGIGDSIMFGWGVGDGEDYLSLVEARIAAHGGPPVEILNTAVPGYNTVMEVATLAEKALVYQPDLVVVGLCGNDAGLPYFLKTRPDVFSARTSFLLDFVRGRLAPRAQDDDGDALVVRPGGAGRRAVERGDTERVPPDYRHMVGIGPFEGALSRLRELGRSRGFEILVVYYPGAPVEMREIVDRLGLPSVNTAGAIRLFLHAHGGEAGLPLLRVSARDPHPSAAGHALIARVLFEHLRKSGFLRPGPSRDR